MQGNRTYKGHVLSRMGRILLKIVYSVLVLLFLAVLVTSVSPIYDFREPQPFSGPDIFNPYRNLDTAYCWKRANFHTHTRVKGPFPPNECEEWPDETFAEYERFGYDIVTFSNHNEITAHPFDSTLQVNVYEQGAVRAGPARKAFGLHPDQPSLPDRGHVPPPHGGAVGV